MILTYMALTFRQIIKSKGQSLLNITGLAVGTATFTLILFYSGSECSFDRYHDRPENIYRIIADHRVGTEGQSMAWTPPALAPNAEEKFPEIEHALRLFRYRSPVVVLEHGSDKNFTEENFLWGDSTIFSVFRFVFVRGTPGTQLARPNTVVISETMAKKYFDDKDPIGKILTNPTFNADFEITGVFRDMPVKSHFKADFICSLITLPKLWGDGILTSWGNSFLYSYIKTTPKADVVALENKINALAGMNLPVTEEASYRFKLQPVVGIHLHSHVQNEWQANSDIRYIYILLAVGTLILLVSTINFINLCIARSGKRTKEIGIRQAIGSSRKQLGLQFVTENLVYGTMAFLLSIALIEFFLPVINALAGEDLSVPASDRVVIFLITGTGVLVLMLIASVYPARIISLIKPVIALKGTPVKLHQGIGLWQGLITFQVVVTTMLITAVLLINRQLTFISTNPAGYNIRGMMNITLLSDHSQDHYEQLKSEFLQNSGIKSASGVSHLIGGMLYQSGYSIYKRDQERVPVMWQRIHADHDFCKTYGVQIIAGRDFSTQAASDTMNFIVNAAACRALGFKNASEAIGTEVGYGNGQRGKIIGVMNDFHFKTLHHKIEPLIIHIVPDRFRFLTLSINTVRVKETLAWLESRWNAFEPSSPFVYSLQEDAYSSVYAFERKFSNLINFFAIVVVVLSAGGLIGLNMYISTLKRKEIGIRKILGAKTSGLVIDFMQRFAIIAFAGFIISIPISWYLLETWLNGFSYKVTLSPELFIIGGMTTVIISTSSVLLPSLMASMTKPVEVLKEN
jgi:putative ABC transport system permease protein